MTFNIFEEFSSNETEENGTWVPMGPGVAIKVRSFQSQRSQAVRVELERPYAGFKAGGREIPEDAQNEITIKQIAQGVLVDWKGFKNDDADENGENATDLPFSVEAAEAMLTKLPKFRDFIGAIVMNKDTFKAKTIEAEAKN